MGGSRLGGLWPDSSADSNCHLYSMCTSLHSSISPCQPLSPSHAHKAGLKCPFLWLNPLNAIAVKMSPVPMLPTILPTAEPHAAFSLWLFSFFLLSFWLWTNSFFKIPFVKVQLENTVHLSTDGRFILSKVLLQSTGTHQLPLMKCLIVFSNDSRKIKYLGSFPHSSMIQPHKYVARCVKSHSVNNII